MNEYKKCPHGHYYQGDICPYCESVKKKPNNLVKVCSNHHVYNSELNSCPICASAIINSEYEWGHDTIVCYSINLFGMVTIKVDGRGCYGIRYINVYMSRGNKYRYCFSRGGSFSENEICIEPEGMIQIGDSIMTGRELIKICDLVLDNHLSFIVHNRFSTTIEVGINDLMPLNQPKGIFSNTLLEGSED